MKTKVTKKQVLSSYSNILELVYCDLQHLLNHFSPSYYTAGVYSWNADIYIIDGMCIVTGYRPFGIIRPSREDKERANKEYNELSNQLSYEEKTKEVKAILKSLFK